MSEIKSLVSFGSDTRPKVEAMAKLTEYNIIKIVITVTRKQAHSSNSFVKQSAENLYARCTHVCQIVLFDINMLYNPAIENMNNIFYCSVKSTYVAFLTLTLTLITTNYCSGTFFSVTWHRQRFLFHSRPHTPR